jgi:hypothetical protein
VAATGDLDAVMAGLARGEVSPATWEIVATAADAFIAIDDRYAQPAGAGTRAIALPQRAGDAGRRVPERDLGRRCRQGRERGRRDADRELDHRGAVGRDRRGLLDVGDGRAIARCDLDLTRSYKNTTFNFARHREPQA